MGLATAAPKTGPAIFCPSCYLDCAKSTVTDDAGRFAIANLDPTLKFHVLCTAATKKTSLTGLYDPATGPLTIKLQERPNVPAAQIARGRLVSDQGLPIAGALVEPSGAKTAGRRWWGRVDADPAVSDKDGQFEIMLPEDFAGIDLEISADGFAVRIR